MSIEKPEQEDSCIANNPEVFVKASLGWLKPDMKEELQEHAENCSRCLNLWLEVSNLMEELQIKDAAPLIKALHEQRKKAASLTTPEILQQTPQPVRENKLYQIPVTSRLSVQNTLTESTIFPTTENQNLLINKNTRTILGLSLASATLVIATILLISVFPAFYQKTNKKLNSSTLSGITNNTRVTEGNLYQQLDSEIDQYLDSSNKNYLTNAENLALEIKQRHEDNYGVDLVKYYKQVKAKDFQQLKFLRQEIKDLDALPFSANDSENYLTTAQKLEENLLVLGNVIESYKAKHLLAKRYLLTSDTAYEPIVNKGIRYAESNNYLFLKAHFLLWKAKAKSNAPNGLEAKKRLEEVLALSKQLQLNDTLPTIAMSLAGVYQKHGENQKALEISEQALIIPGAKYTTTISLMHVAGMSAFQLTKYDISNKYFQEAIALGEKHNDSFNISLSYTFSASFASEKGNFAESQELLRKAEDIAKTVKDERPKTRLLLAIRGYQAKAQLKEGKYLEASLLYKEALSTLDKIGIEANLMQASELNEGLALALEKTGSKDSSYHHTIAAYFFQKSGVKNQQISCLLSFLPNQCN